MNHFLIAHKVRGKLALDVAQQVQCTDCRGNDCPMCTGTGFWWVIPTSGHRAYPFWSATISLTELEKYFGLVLDGSTISYLPKIPDPWPDHYSINDRGIDPNSTSGDLATAREALGLVTTPAPSAKAFRRPL